VRAYVDASVLISLGGLDELERLTVFDAEPVVLPRVFAEVATEPERTALAMALERGQLARGAEPDDAWLQKAAAVLGDPVETADGHLLAAVLRAVESGRQPAIISDDHRIRTVSEGLGATVTGAVGVVSRNVDEGLDPATAKALVRPLDQSGLHMTASLIERGFDLIDSAAE
jgi:predicted nucleic acid-binding protein